MNSSRKNTFLSDNVIWYVFYSKYGSFRNSEKNLILNVYYIFRSPTLRQQKSYTLLKEVLRSESFPIKPKSDIINWQTSRESNVRIEWMIFIRYYKYGKE